MTQPPAYALAHGHQWLALPRRTPRSRRPAVPLVNLPPCLIVNDQPIWTPGLEIVSTPAEAWTTNDPEVAEARRQMAWIVDRVMTHVRRLA